MPVEGNRWPFFMYAIRCPNKRDKSTSTDYRPNTRCGRILIGIDKEQINDNVSFVAKCATCKTFWKVSINGSDRTISQIPKKDLEFKDTLNLKVLDYKMEI